MIYFFLNIWNETSGFITTLAICPISEAVNVVSTGLQDAGCLQQDPRDGSSRGCVAQGCSSQGRGHEAAVTGGSAALWHGDSPGARPLGTHTQHPAFSFLWLCSFNKDVEITNWERKRRSRCGK